MTSSASGLESQASGVRPQAARRIIGGMTGGSQAEATPDPFVAHRGLLFTVAYEMLSSAADAEDAEFAESVSIAMLTVLKTLGPAERAVFVLHEVFDTPYAEIAEALDKSSAAVRQIGHRAREHVAAFLAMVAQAPDFAAGITWFNGMPGIRIDAAGEPTAVSMAIENGRITRIYAIRNPDKLRWLNQAADLRR